MASLRAYVRKRNGVPLGAAGSLQNMLGRSFTAASFPQFWWYWNPIWGYYLGKFVMQPTRSVVPAWLAVLVTFGVSGGIHDLAVSAIKLTPFLFFTPWFLLMGGVVVIYKLQGWSHKKLPAAIRVLINLTILISTFSLTSYFF